MTNDMIQPSDSAIFNNAPPQSPVIQKPSKSVLIACIFSLLAAIAAIAANIYLNQQINTLEKQIAQQKLQLETEKISSQDNKSSLKNMFEINETNRSKIALMEERFSEISTQNQQLNNIMQNISQSRDNNLLYDIHSNLQLAQQQAHISGSIQPLTTYLEHVRTRIENTSQPSTSSLVAAIDKDLHEFSAIADGDILVLIKKLDEISELIDQLPLQADVGIKAHTASMPKSQALNTSVNNKNRPPLQSPAKDTDTSLPHKVNQWKEAVLSALRDLIIIRNIENPHAIHLTQDQVYFLRENIKLKVLTIRTLLVNRSSSNTEFIHSQLNSIHETIALFFDSKHAITMHTQSLLGNIIKQNKLLTIPEPKQTQALLATLLASSSPKIQINTNKNMNKTVKKNIPK